MRFSSVALILVVGCASSSEVRDLQDTVQTLQKSQGGLRDPLQTLQKAQEAQEALRDTLQTLQKSQGALRDEVQVSQEVLRDEMQLSQAELRDEVQLSQAELPDEMQEAVNHLGDSIGSVWKKLYEIEADIKKLPAPDKELAASVAGIRQFLDVRSGDINAMLAKKEELEQLVSELQAASDTRVDALTPQVMTILKKSPSWTALRYTAHRSDIRAVNSYWQSYSRACFIDGAGGYFIIVGLVPQPVSKQHFDAVTARWDFSEGDQRANLQEAAGAIHQDAAVYKVEPISKIMFFFSGNNLGTWYGGDIYLPGEDVPE